MSSPICKYCHDETELVHFCKCTDGLCKECIKVIYLKNQEKCELCLAPINYVFKKKLKIKDFIDKKLPIINYHAINILIIYCCVSRLMPIQLLIILNLNEYIFLLYSLMVSLYIITIYNLYYHINYTTTILSILCSNIIGYNIFNKNQIYDIICGFSILHHISTIIIYVIDAPANTIYMMPIIKLYRNIKQKYKRIMDEIYETEF
jgi:hypothetical protein